MTYDQLIEALKNINPKSIGGSSLPGSKYHDLYNEILHITDYFPSYIGIERRIKYLLTGAKGPKQCECGCGQTTNNPLVRFIRGHGNKTNDVKDAKRKTSLDHYGVEYPSQVQEIKDKKETTFKQRYNSTCYFDSEIGKEKYKQKMLEKYGVDNPFKSKELKEMVRNRWEQNKEGLAVKIQSSEWKTFLPQIEERIGKEYTLLDLDQYKGVKGNYYKFQCKKCNNTFFDNLDNGRMPRCLVCQPISYSNQEKEIVDFLSKFGIPLELHQRSLINPYEIDIHIPSLKLAIEFNGLYWHSDRNEHIDPKYHLTKTKKCQDIGIRLIQIFSDELEKKPKIVFSRLRHLVGKDSYRIFARNCVVKEVDFDLKKKFLTKYHIQGMDQSKINLGLYYKNRLVSLMTFSKLRKALGNRDQTDHYELSRYCSINNFNIIGGAGKLLKHFERQYKPKCLISYADRRWSAGELYLNLGFKFDHYTSPNYWYTLDFKDRIYRFSFRKSELVKKLTIFDPNKSELENMRNNGYYRIWDCGHYMFKKEYGE